MLSRLLITVPLALALTAVAGSASASADVLQNSSLSTTIAGAAQPQGIIMSDGRICNPRWGC